MDALRDNGYQGDPYSDRCEGIHFGVTGIHQVYTAKLNIKLFLIVHMYKFKHG